MVLDDAETARECNAAGEHSGERAEGREVVAAEKQQVLAVGTNGLGAEAELRAVGARDACEVVAELDRGGLVRLAVDPDRAL